MQCSDASSEQDGGSAFFGGLMAQKDAAPMKVWLPESSAQPMRTLDPALPAKKRPVYAEFCGAAFASNCKRLDPLVPAKKRVTKFLLREPPFLIPVDKAE